MKTLKNRNMMKWQCKKDFEKIWGEVSEQK